MCRQVCFNLCSEMYFIAETSVIMAIAGLVYKTAGHRPERSGQRLEVTHERGACREYRRAVHLLPATHTAVAPA
jgi:hypothetical protein